MAALLAMPWRQKLIRLSPQRLQQILLKLEQLGLISELLLVPEVQLAENFDSAEIERFLHQDPLDPVTVISFEPEQDFELTAPGLAATSNTLPSININSWVAQRTAPPQAQARRPPSQRRAASIFICRWARRRRRARIRCRQIGCLVIAAPPVGQAPDAERKPSWEYWFIGIGVLFIMLSLLMRYLH